MRRAAVATALGSSATRIRWVGPGLLVLVALAACGQSAGADRIAAGDEPSTSTTTTDGSTTSSSSSTSTTASSSTSTTASSSTTTTTLPPTAGAPAPTTWRFEGRYSGDGHFALNTGRCPFLDHELGGTFTLSDGTAWSFRSEFCGTIDGTGMWSGAGTFALTAADGSRLAGTTANSAQLPTVGEPYTLDVHTGTGQYEGATGICDLDNHVRMLEFGVQEQWGTFVCHLTRH